MDITSIKLLKSLVEGQKKSSELLGIPLHPYSTYLVKLDNKYGDLRESLILMKCVIPLIHD